MKCPRDGNELAPFTLRKVELDCCTYCEGAWLDPGELGQVLGLGPELLPGATAVSASYEPLTCPKCEVAMNRALTSGPDQVEVDVCGDCGGIWLDTDELKRMLQMAYDLKQQQGG